MLALGTPGRSVAQTRQSQAHLSLVDAVDRALAQYPSLAASRAREVAARASVAEAQAAGLPTVQLLSSAVQYQRPSIVSPIHGLTPGTAPPFDETLFQTGLSAAYTLFDGGTRAASVAQARAQLDAEEAVSDVTERQIISRVVSTYARVLSRREILDAQDHRAAALQAELTRVGRLLEVGRAATIDRLRVSAALASAAAERVRSIEALDIAERDLARLLQVSPDQTRASRLIAIQITGIEIDPRDRLLEAALTANAAVQEAHRRLSVADAAIGLASASRNPRVNIVGNVINFGSAAGHFTTEWNAGVQLSYPIFNRGTDERVARAQATRAAAAEQVRLAELQVAEELDRALSAIRESAAQTDSLTSAVERFAEVARIEALRLDTGVGTQTDFLNAQADVVLGRSALAEVHAGEVVARVELARIVGGLGRAWLQQNVMVTQ